MALILKNVTWFEGSERQKKDIHLPDQFVERWKNKFRTKKEVVFNLDGLYAYRGLVNAHDHLEMNLYPRLGNPPYQNYVQWANDIYKPGESPIVEIEKINVRDRLLWGGLKNLISGATTVVHHNPWHRVLRANNFPVQVVQKMHWAHSLAFEKKSLKNLSKANIPFVIHAAEGIDDWAAREIHQLDKSGLLKKNTVLIHAVGIREPEIELIQKRNSSVVWCPASNLFMFHSTAPIKKMWEKEIPLTIGTDSTLTGSPTLLNEMRQAINTRLIDPAQLFKMVTSSPQKIFGLINGPFESDFFVTLKKSDDYIENLMITNPADIQLVFTKGRVQLLDSRLGHIPSLKYTCQVQGQQKQLMVDVESLKKRIKKKVNEEILKENSLWNLIDA